MSGAEDQQMRDLRTNLENELRLDNYEGKVEAKLKELLAGESYWEKRIKDECLRVIQGQNDLTNVNIDLLTNQLMGNAELTKIPNNIESEIEKMILDRLKKSEHYTKFINDI